MANYFDQFDGKSNFFDQFDEGSATASPTTPQEFAPEYPGDSPGDQQHSVTPEDAKYQQSAAQLQQVLGGMGLNAKPAEPSPTAPAKPSRTERRADITLENATQLGDVMRGTPGGMLYKYLGFDIGKPAEGVYAGMHNVGGSIVGAAARLLPGESELAKEINRERELIGQKVEKQSGMAGTLAMGATESLVPAFSAGRFAGPAGVVGWFAQDAYGKAYQEARDAGKSKLQAELFAYRAASIEGGVAYLGGKVGKLLGGGRGIEDMGRALVARSIGQAFRHHTVSLGAEIGEEMVTEAMNAVNEDLSGIKPGAMSLDQLGDRMFDTALQTLVTAGISETTQFGGISRGGGDAQQQADNGSGPAVSEHQAVEGRNDDEMRTDVIDLQDLRDRNFTDEQIDAMSVEELRAAASMERSAIATPAAPETGEQLEQPIEPARTDTRTPGREAEQQAELEAEVTPSDQKIGEANAPQPTQHEDGEGAKQRTVETGMQQEPVEQTGKGDAKVGEVQTERVNEPPPANGGGGDDEAQQSDRPPGFSARQAEVEETRRAMMGNPEPYSPDHRSWLEASRTAQQQGLNQPDKAMSLAENVTAAPRAMNDVETAGLVGHGATLKDRHRALLQTIARSTDDAEVAGLVAERTRLEQDFELLANAINVSGSEKGRALAAQKMTLDQDMDLLSVTTRAAANKRQAGKQLTTKERAMLEDLTRKYAAAQQQIAELQAKYDDAIVHRAVSEHRRHSRRTADRAKSESVADRAKRVAALLKAGCN